MSKIISETGQRIRNYRIQQGLSQEALSEKSGLHPTYIGQIERGEKNATLESIEKIAKGLSIPLSRLFENIDSSGTEVNYPAEAYSLVQSVPVPVQENLVKIITAAVEIKNMN